MEVNESDQQILMENEEMDICQDEVLSTPGSPQSECSSPLAPAMSPITTSESSSSECLDSSDSSDSSINIDAFLGPQVCGTFTAI